MASGTRVLYHTKGVILTDLALETESVEIARRRLTQAEDVFRKSIAMQRRDGYGYHGLAKLFLGWARRAVSEEEKADYLSRAEEAISEGLKQARQRERLYVASSEIHHFLGDEPAAVKSLERAIEMHPESGVARYLLARFRLKDGDPHAAIVLIKPTLERDPEDFRAAALYARALDVAGKPLSEGIAILHQASLYGMRDPRFVATLGGMLFMNGEFTEAEALFKEALDKGFTFDELKRVEFEPKQIVNPTEFVRLEGKVINVKAGFAFVEAPGYPAFFCHYTKYGDVVMELGKRLTFQAAFSPRGPVALHPQEA